MGSPWDELEEVKVNKKFASPWDELEEVKPEQPNGEDLSNFDNILNMQNEPTMWDKAGNILQGGVKFVENKANQLSDAYSNPAPNGGVSIKQGLSNLGNAALEGIQNIPQGVLAFGGQLLNDTGSTAKNIVQNPASILDAPDAFISGMYSGGRNLLQGAIDIPEAISSAYNGREFQRQYELPGINDIATDILQKVLVDTGIKSQEKFDESIALINQLRKQEAEKRSQLPIVSTAGEFSLPVGAMKALKIGGKSTKLAAAGGAAKKASVLSDIGKAGTVGAGFGALTPGDLKEKVTGTGVGTIVGGATGGVMRATPHIKNAAKVTGAVGKAVTKEAVNRVNPKNYNAVIDSVPVEKGVGLSQRTVYEPKTRYEYKLNEKLDNMKRAKVVQGEAKQPGTDFVMKESGELKTPQRPEKPTVKNHPAVVNTSAVSEKLRKLAPNTIAKQEAKNKEKVNTNEVVDTESNTKGKGTLENEKANGYNDNNIGVKNEQQSSDIQGKSQARQVGRKDAESENRGRSNGDSGRGDESRLVSERKRGQLTEADSSVINEKYKNQHELNKAIEAYIKEEKYKNYDNLPEEVKEWLKKYSGAGGLEKQGAEGRGLLSEYYTPHNIVKKMWDITSQYVKTDGSKVLEPSVGIGRFLEHAPKNTSFDVVEMNPISAKITELLYPDANIEVGEFQQRFIDEKKNTPIKKVEPKYDIVIGNPPYGQYSGRYKGLGEGKNFSRLEAYFINRGLDSLKENGIMTFIVPSSFLDGAINIGKQEIGKKAELIDAYRLPENTFDTTSIGTDIVVLRKNTQNGMDGNINAGRWFSEHPEKILGSVESRKNRFGKMENFVKGGKDAVEKIDTSNKDIKETIAEVKPAEKPAQQKTEVITKKKPKTAEKAKTNIEYERYVPERTVSDDDYNLFADTKVDGTLPAEKYKGQIETNDKINKFKGEYYNDFNYLQGDIYEKLDALEREDISSKKKELQRKKLMSVLPKPKDLTEMSLTPTSDFIREMTWTEKVEDRWTQEEKEEMTSFDKKYLEYVRTLTDAERNGLSMWDIDSFVKGEKIRTRYRSGSSKEDKENQRAEHLTNLKNTVDKTFNDFLNSELTDEQRTRIQNEWNRKFNNLHTPDYKNMPMLVKDLNATFYGKKLKLQDVQVEGINYLTNKGVGLLGFEVGVGKTLSGIVSTVQNMQMGRCKKPLILVPKQVKDNWIREIRETFPNIEVNDIDNLSRFNGEIKDGSLSIGTYQALDNVWYKPDTLAFLKSNAYSIRNDFNRDSTKRGLEKANERNEEFIGKAEAGNKKKYFLEDLGFDHITVDEAHNFKNLFADAKADGQEGNTYTKITGGESTRAKRLFLATQYILANNHNRNVFMLTATPFNNSPLEVFNMLSYIAKDKLDKMGIYNVYQFMENYVDIDADWVVDSKNNVVFKQIAKGFKNLQSLQGVIDSAMLIRSAEDAGIKRPNKHTKKVILNPTQEQLNLIAEAESEAITNKKNSGAVLKAISKSRTATLSPDIYKNNLSVSPEDFVKNSPKLNYVMNAVESMKKKHPNTSQLIYMPLGVEFLPKLKKYLVEKGIFEEKEVAIIKSGIDDDKISDIVDSFNDTDGDVKLIIGTNKIKEGMNLNKNSSVLYVPFMDWNPTDYLQIVGRIWRRGNRYKDIRVVVPLLKDSSDPFLFQKNDEKASRINNIMDRGKNYIDTSELDAAEEKINMIANPEKKASMFSQIESQKLDNERRKLSDKRDTSQAYQRELSEVKYDIERAEKGIKNYTERLAEIEDKESWTYKSALASLDSFKKDLSKAKHHSKYLNSRIARLELDFNGKDSIENIEKQIAAVDEKIANLEVLTEKKLAQYRDEYEKNRKTGKKIEDHIREFEKDTEELYKDLEENDIELPSFLGKNQATSGNIDINLEPIYKAIRGEVKAVDIINLLPDEIAGLIDRVANDYIVSELKNADKTRGLHSSGKKKIFLNLERIGDNPYQFVSTFVHEIRHAAQDKAYSELLAKRANGEKLSPEENDYINKIAECRKANKERRRFYKANKKIIDKYHKDIEKIDTENEYDDYIANMDPKEYNVIEKYLEVFDDYYSSFMEEDARIQGEKYAEKYVRRGTQETGPAKSKENLAAIPGLQIWLSETFGRNGRTGIPKRGSDEEAEIEPHKFANLNETDEKAIRSKIKNKVYKWYGDTNTDRYDVAKSLNSFINLSKTKADRLSQKIGIRVTDTQLREILPFLRERTGFPESFNRDDLRKIFNKLSEQDKQSLTDFADSVSDKFEKYYKNYTEAKGTPDPESIENHISHIWKLDDKKKSLLTNYITTNSKFAKKRTIGTLLEGIDGIEINGETVQFEPKTLDYAEILLASSDNLIKATHDSILANEVKNLRYKGKPLVLPAAKAPEEWVEVNHPALSKAVYMGSVSDNELPILMKTPVKVHPEIADYVGAIFEVQKNSKFWNAFDSLNGMVKQSLLGFSGFHGYALSESSVGNVGARKTLKELNPKKFVDAIKNGNYDVYKNEEAAKRAIKAGVQLGTPSDLQRNLVEESLKKIPYLGKYTAGIVSANNKVLWDVLHNNFKVIAFNTAVENIEKKGKISTEEERAIAQWVNDSFGGQAWELLGVKKSTIKAASRILLSPDWNFSTIRQATAAINSEWLDSRLGESAIGRRIGKLTGAGEETSTNGVRGKIGRAFWIRSAIYFTVFYNLLNAMFREKDKEEHPDLYPEKMTPFDYSIWSNSYPMDSIYDKIMPKVFIGRNSDGTARMLRVGKQFREVPEFATQPIEKLGGKTSPAIGITSQTAFGMTPGDVMKKLTGKEVYLNQDIWDGYGEDAKMREGAELAKGRAKALGKSLVPYIGSKYIGGKHEFSMWDFVAQTSAGSSKSKVYKQVREALRNGKGGEIKNIKKKAIQDGLPEKTVDKMVDFAGNKYKAENTKTYKQKFISALQNNDKKELKRITETMRKNHLPVEEQRRIYEKAYKNYLGK